ncbi:MAG: phosphotransferase family protein [Anaerolineae bacterium]
MAERREAAYREGLQTYVKAVFPDRDQAQVADLHEISVGWESDVFAFDLVSGPSGDRAREPMILRVYPGVDAWEKSAREYDGLKRLLGVGYPVPRVFHLARESSPFGRPFLIMERVPGRPIWAETFHGPEPTRRAHFDLFIRLFVRLHAIDWRDLVGDDPTPFLEDPYTFVDHWLDRFRGVVAELSQPGYVPVLDWLTAKRGAVPCLRPAPIHWDYHPDNILLDRTGSATVIDWTQYEISDPRFDLAWTMTLVGAGEGEEVRERIRERYEAVAGTRLEGMVFFEVFACAKRLASVTISLAAGAEQLGMRPGAEEAMRRQIPALSRVYERLLALAGTPVPEVEAVLSGGV